MIDNKELMEAFLKSQIENRKKDAIIRNLRIALADALGERTIVVRVKDRPMPRFHFEENINDEIIVHILKG